MITVWILMLDENTQSYSIKLVLILELSDWMSIQLDFRNPAGYDRTRNAVIGRRSIDLTYLEEAYTSEHWLVRIYRFGFLLHFKIISVLEIINSDFSALRNRVKKPHEFNRPNIDKKSRRFLTKPNYVSKKVSTWANQ